MSGVLTISKPEFVEFAKQYFPRATELLIIAEKSCTGGMVLGENLRSGIDFAAAVWPQSIEKYGIYHIRARRKHPAKAFVQYFGVTSMQIEAPEEESIRTQRRRGL